MSRAAKPFVFSSPLARRINAERIDKTLTHIQVAAEQVRLEPVPMPPSDPKKAPWVIVGPELIFLGHRCG